jgi:flavodoxin/Fe-S-cluster-containing hydrogenase component 2
MKSSILTFSQTGNTLKVADAVAAGLGKAGIEVEHVPFLRRRNWNPGAAGLVGVGCPVFENRPAEVVPDFLMSAGIDLTGKSAFVFITSGGTPARSLWHLAEAVRRTGATVIGGFQARGTSAFPTLAGLFPGRPNAIDLERAQDFGNALAGQVSLHKPLGDDYLVDRPRGRRFYDVVGPCMAWLKKKGTPVPESDPAACDLCGACVAECPSRSIRIQDRKVIVRKSCIRCSWCWQICPKMAITMKFSPGQGALERWVYSEGMERRFGDVQPGEDVGTNRYREVLARTIRVRFDPDNRSAELHPAERYSRRGRATLLSGEKSQP